MRVGDYLTNGVGRKEVLPVSVVELVVWPRLFPACGIPPGRPPPHTGVD